MYLLSFFPEAQLRQQNPEGPRCYESRIQTGQIGPAAEQELSAFWTRDVLGLRYLAVAHLLSYLGVHLVYLVLEGLFEPLSLLVLN